MTDYIVAHIWQYPDGDPYLRIVPGTVPHIDIAFYVADLITTETGQPSGVYVLDTATAELIRQERPAEPTMDPADIPPMRVEPPSEEGGPPDILTVPDPSGGGLSLMGGAGAALLTHNPETDPGTEQITTTDTGAPVDHKEE